MQILLSILWQSQSLPISSESVSSEKVYVLTPVKSSKIPKNAVVLKKLRKDSDEIEPVYAFEDKTYSKRRLRRPSRLSYIDNAEFPAIAKK